MIDGNLVRIALVAALTLCACKGGADGGEKTFAQDLELMCEATHDEGVKMATPDKRLMMWAHAVSKGLGSAQGKELFKGLETVASDQRCGYIYASAKAEGVEWSCHSLCPALEIHGFEFLDSLHAAVVVGESPTEDGVLVGMRRDAIVTPDGKTLATLEDGNLSKAPALDDLSKPTGSGVLQVLGDPELPAATLIRLARAAKTKGFESFEIIGLGFPIGAVLDFMLPSYPSPVSMGGGFGGAPRGEGIGGPAEAVAFGLAEKTLTSVTLVLDKRGVTVVRDGAALPAIPRCQSASAGPTVCLANPEASYPPARYDWVGTYNLLLELKHGGAKLEGAQLHVDPDLPIQVLSVALDVLRNERVSDGNEGAPKGEVFDVPEALSESRPLRGEDGKLVPLVGRPALAIAGASSIPKAASPAEALAALDDARPGFGAAGRPTPGRDYQQHGATPEPVDSAQPQVSPGRPDVSGNLDMRIIRKVVNMNKRPVKDCYEAELVKIAGLNGQIVVRFTIDQTGNVPTAVVDSSTMGNEDVETCLTSAIRSWRFPAPKGGGQVIVSYPFAFETK